MKHILSINLTCVRQKQQVLTNINCTLNTHHITLLTGPNGAGKTTLLNCIFNLIPYNGLVLFNGHNLSQLPPQRIPPLGLAYIPENKGLFPELTVKENLSLSGHNTKRTLRNKTLNHLLNLSPSLKKKQHLQAGFLSGGEQQYLAVLKTLMMNPKLLLLDEPLNGLSPKWKSSLLNLLKTLKQNGMTILMAEQPSPQCKKITNTTWTINKGHLQNHPTSQHVDT